MPDLHITLKRKGKTVKDIPLYPVTSEIAKSVYSDGNLSSYYDYIHRTWGYHVYDEHRKLVEEILEEYSDCYKEFKYW